MTDGPYNESIRGPGNAGLGGIFAQLAAIAAGLGALPTLAADVAAIRARLDADLPTLLTRLGWLSGTTVPISAFGNGGLPLYLAQAIANRQTASNEGVTMWDWLLSLDDSGGRITSSLGGADPAIGLADNLWLRQLEALQALLAVTGDINAAPVGSTLKDLARSIDINALRSAECCEEGQSGTPFPPPTGNCGNEATTWTECTLELRFSEVEGNDVYAVVFPASITSVEAFVADASVYSGANADPGLVVQSQETGNALSLSACIAWNFGALSELIDYAVGVPLVGEATPFNSYTSTSEPPLQEGTELITWQARTDAGVRRALQANFGFPNGVAPVGKVYVGLPTP